MIGLVDYDWCTSNKITILLPNIEIMKLATYYKLEENKFCRLLTLDEEDLSGYEKIYFFSESHSQPEIPKHFLRANQIIYGGTAFTKGKYIPFDNEIIDYTIPRTFIYKEFLKQKYDDGVKAKIISQALDSTYYRCYAKNKLPIPPIIPNKRVILYDRDFFYPDWRETLYDIIEHKPSSILRVHPIVCHKLSDFFEVRNFPKFGRTNDVILDLNIPLEEVYYMINKYKNKLLADISPNSSVFLKLGGNYSTNFQYFKDFIYKINLIYCFWSSGIMIKIRYEPPFIGYKNPLSGISEKVQTWADIGRVPNRSKTINEKITKKGSDFLVKERDLLLKFYPSAKDLFNHSYESIVKGGRWRV